MYTALWLLWCCNGRCLPCHKRRNILKKDYGLHPCCLMMKSTMSLCPLAAAACRGRCPRLSCTFRRWGSAVYTLTNSSYFPRAAICNTHVVRQVYTATIIHLQHTIFRQVYSAAIIYAQHTCRQTGIHCSHNPPATHVLSDRYTLQP